MNSILNATLPDFWSLWIKHQDYLYSACLKWMSNIPDAEDIMSQAMLKAEEKMRIYAVNNFRNWVTKLTYNLCLDFQRKRYQTIQYGDIQNVTSGLSDFYLWIKTLETDTGIRGCELPIYRFL
jgi:RNA polymerase sigma-70 factor (ECF subfamily)